MSNRAKANRENHRQKDGKFGEQPKSEPVGVSLSEPVMTVTKYGTKEWYVNGQRHREDGPAVEWADGTKAWYVNGQRHREDGPAVEWADGSKAWYLNGQRHREDGPAADWANGTKMWFLNGQLHREDGPAAEWANGDKEWWVNGEELSEADFQTRMGATG